MDCCWFCMEDWGLWLPWAPCILGWTCTTDGTEEDLSLINIFLEHFINKISLSFIQIKRLHHPCNNLNLTEIKIWKTLRTQTLHRPGSGLLSHLALLLLLSPTRSRDLVGSHEGTRLCHRHQVVGRNHAWVSMSNETTRHTLGSDSVLCSQVLLAFLGWIRFIWELTKYDPIYNYNPMWHRE